MTDALISAVPITLFTAVREPFPTLIFKAWHLSTIEGNPYTLAVLNDGSLWLKFGTSKPVQLDASALAATMLEVTDAIEERLVIDAHCPWTHTVNVGTGQYTLTCDLPNNHNLQVHHDPTPPNGVGIFWLAD